MLRRDIIYLEDDEDLYFFVNESTSTVAWDNKFRLKHNFAHNINYSYMHKRAPPSYA